VSPRRKSPFADALLANPPRGGDIAGTDNHKWQDSRFRDSRPFPSPRTLPRSTLQWRLGGNLSRSSSLRAIHGYRKVPT